tara:strand:+ start:113 stop:727 length:615 start_codon:yes stop_codon:yes gene_type:complete
MMYALLTQKDGSFDVPVRWEGTNVLAPELKEFTNVTFSKAVVKNGHLPHFGIFPLNVINPPAGKRAKGDPVDTFNGTTVSREAAVEDDPGYDASGELTDEQKAFEAEILSATKSRKIVDVKAEAQKRILAILPDWKQRNFAFLYKQVSDGTASDAQKAEMDAAVALWEKIDAVRSKSDEIEAAIASMDKDAVNLFIISDDANWS